MFKLSNFTLGLGLFIIISATFMQQVRKFIIKTLGEVVPDRAFILVSLIFLLCIIFFLVKSKRSLFRIFLTLMVLILGYLFAKKQPYASENFHVLEYGLLGWVSVRDLMRNKVTLKNSVCVGLFVVLVAFSDEFLQFILPYRVGELRDFFTNIVSLIFGGGLFLLQ